jgi:hypothetical protein
MNRALFQVTTTTATCDATQPETGSRAFLVPSVIK